MRVDARRRCILCFLFESVTPRTSRGTLFGEFSIANRIANKNCYQEKFIDSRKLAFRNEQAEMHAFFMFHARSRSRNGEPRSFPC